MRPEPLLWLDDHRGIYIPRDFANSFSDRATAVSGVDAETWKILEAGPDHEFYWDAWHDVLNDATVTDDGTTYTVYQDGACWLIPAGMEWSDSNEFFVWPDEDENEDEDEGEDEGDDRITE